MDIRVTADHYLTNEYNRLRRDIDSFLKKNGMIQGHLAELCGIKPQRMVKFMNGYIKGLDDSEVEAIESVLRGEKFYTLNR